MEDLGQTIGVHLPMPDMGIALSGLARETSDDGNIFMRHA